MRARQSRTYVSRFIVAAVSAVAAIFCLIVASWNSSPSGAGSDLFYILGWTSFGLCLLEGIRVTSDSISEEKREGTLGLLFLTDLRSEEIVLGKQAGVSLNSLFSLMAVVPALGVPLLLGGVTAGEFWRLVIALFVGLFFSLAIGTAISVVSETMIVAYARSTGILLLSTVLLPLMDLGLAASGTDLGLRWFGPTGMLLGLNADVYDATPAFYWRAVAVSFLIGIGLLAIACRALPRFWDRSGERAPELQRTIARRASRWLPEQVEADPMGWLATSQSWRLRLFPRVACGIAAIWLLTACLAPADSTVLVALCVTALITHSMINLWQGLNAVSVGATLRSTGFIELLLIAPMSMHEVVLGMGRGTARYCAATAAVFAVAEFLAVGVFAFRWVLAIPGDASEAVFISCVALFVLYGLHIDLWGASWMGLYQGLVQRKRATATMLTVVWVQLLPLALYGLCFYLGPVFVIIKSVVVMLWARDRLLFEFPRLVRAHHLPEEKAQRKVFTGLMEAPPLPRVQPRSGPG